MLSPGSARFDRGVKRELFQRNGVDVYWIVDLDARIKALQTSVDRMTQLLAQATRIEDLLAIETQLSQRQAELDSLKAQRTWLELLFLSTTTMTSTGLTDVVPVKPLARSIVMVQQIAGMLYLAVAVSRIVGLTINRRRAAREDA